MSRKTLLEELASCITAVQRPHPVRVAVDGVDAAGKTTLADELAARLRARGRAVVRASVDGFHRPARIRHRRGTLSPEGYFRDAFDHEALREALLHPLGPGGSRRYRRAVFDLRTDAPLDAPVEEAPPEAILLFDGVFLLRPELRPHWDFSIFLRARFEVTLERARKRDAALLGGQAEAMRRYRARYVPGQELYLAEVQPERWASLVVDNDGPARPVLVDPGDRSAVRER